MTTPPDELWCPEDAWEQLAADLHGDRAALVGFATSWIRLLPGRTAALGDALRDRNLDAAHDLLLTLRSTATMLGVADLATAATQALEALGSGGVDAGWDHLEAVAAAADAGAVVIAGLIAQEGWSNR
ncbi:MULTISPECIES: hypothetical protein [unclassified Isoptericola]|uniref:hypothetical protein n=1 Tax=Isoptericola sp. NPDC057191 TaxID=3346041 RepID=UPI00362D571E